MNRIRSRRKRQETFKIKITDLHFAQKRYSLDAL